MRNFLSNEIQMKFDERHDHTIDKYVKQSQKNNEGFKTSNYYPQLFSIDPSILKEKK